MKYLIIVAILLSGCVLEREMSLQVIPESEQQIDLSFSIDDLVGCWENNKHIMYVMSDSTGDFFYITGTDIGGTITKYKNLNGVMGIEYDNDYIVSAQFVGDFLLISIAECNGKQNECGEFYFYRTEKDCYR